MLTNLLVRSVHPKLRPLAFALGSLSGLPFVALLAWQLVEARNATQATYWGLMLAGVALVSLTHATVVWAVMADRKGLLWLADALLVLGVAIGFSGVAISTVTPPA